MKHIFTIPKLCPSNMDMSKTWFVYFRYTDKITGKRELFRVKDNLNTIESKKKRQEKAVLLIRVLTEKLTSGWNPITDSAETENKTIVEHLTDILNTKRAVMKIKSVRTYNDIISQFIKYLEKNRYSILFPQNFTPVMARAYMDNLLINKKYSGKTHNHHLGILRTFFNAMVDREIILKNPFKGIAEVQEETGKYFAFTQSEKETLKKHLYKHNRRLYYACQFVYYCFIRRSELIQLRVGDINFESKTITIQSAFAKNRKQESITIPKAFEKVLLEMGLDMAPKDLYIFGRTLKTCNKKITWPDYISTSFRKIADKYNIPKEKGFYSWKHTGICDLYNAIKDPYVIMSQARHHDINITMIYLKSLGLSTNERVRDAKYSF